MKPTDADHPTRKRLGRLARHPVIRNAVALYAVQAARYIVPLALIPFLARVLRPEAFGRLAVAQSLAALLGIIVEFGFMLSATREVARESGSTSRLQEIVSGVLGAKLLLAGVVVLIAAILAVAVPDFRHNPEFLWGACLLAIALGASPAWYFLGIERMPAQTAIEGGGMALAAAVVFAIIRIPGQAAWVLYITAAGVAIAALINHLRLYQRVPWTRPRWSHTAHMLHESLAMFCMRGTIVLYTSANVFLLGLFVPAAAVANFAGAEKLVNALTSLFTTANQAVFPRISHLIKHDRSRGMRLARALLFASALMGAVTAALLAWAAPWVVRLALGPGYPDAVPLLRWLAILVNLLAITNVLGTAILLPLKLDWALTLGGIIAAIVNITLILALVPNFADLGMAWSQIASELAALLVAAFFVYRARPPRSMAASAANPSGT